MEALFELQKTLLDQFNKQPVYQRDIYKKIKIDNRITGVVGMRGVGKTTFLLKTVVEMNKEKTQALYVSAGHVYFLKNTLIELVDRLYKTTCVRLLCLDEVHKYPNWQQELKNIADFYLDVQLVFAGSSMLDIQHSQFDLSRRVTLYPMYGLSFREYLAFHIKVHCPVLSFQQLLSSPNEYIEDLKLPSLLQYFKHYLVRGYFPFSGDFSDEISFFQAVENIVQKTIYEDIATLHSLKTGSLLTIEKLYQYVLTSQPGELSAYKLASALSKDYESISSYLHYIENAGLIRMLYKNQSGKARLRNPIKLYPDNTNLIYASQCTQPKDQLIGRVRETFALQQLEHGQCKVHYSARGDFEVEGVVFEVGGKNKSRKQVKGLENAYVLSDDILLASGVAPCIDWTLTKRPP